MWHACVIVTWRLGLRAPLVSRHKDLWKSFKQLFFKLTSRYLARTSSLISCGIKGPKSSLRLTTKTYKQKKTHIVNQFQILN